MPLVRHLLTPMLLLALFACTSDRHSGGRPSTQLRSSQFKDLLQTVAQGWNTGNARLAADCFAENALYRAPPSSRVRQGRQTLFEFFGGVKDRPKPMSMQWHHIIFDETTQICMGEYTFTYEMRTHGLVIVRIVAGRIANCRDYEAESLPDWAHR